MISQQHLVRWGVARQAEVFGQVEDGVCLVSSQLGVVVSNVIASEVKRLGAFEKLSVTQGPIIQVWPSGQITLAGDVIGSMGGTMRYEATMVFRGPAIKLL